MTDEQFERLMAALADIKVGISELQRGFQKAQQASAVNRDLSRIVAQASKGRRS